MEAGASPFSVENLPSWPRPAGCLGALSSDQRIIKHVHNHFFQLIHKQFSDYDVRETAPPLSWHEGHNMTSAEDSTISRTDAALAMVILASEKKNLLFQRSGVRVSSSDIMMFGPVIQDLLKVASFCANMHAELNFRHRGLRKTTPGEDVLMAAGMDYALDIAPRLPSHGPQGEDIVDIDDLKALVGRIERAFGRIAIDMTFPEEIKDSFKMWQQFDASAPRDPAQTEGQ